MLKSVLSPWEVPETTEHLKNYQKRHIITLPSPLLRYVLLGSASLVHN